MMFAPSSVDLDPYLLPPDVHEAQRANLGIGAPLVLALVLAFAHTLNAWMFFTGGEAASPFMGFVVHAVLVVITALVVRGMIVAGHDGRFLMILLVATTFTGAFGAAGTALSCLLQMWHRPRGMQFLEWFESMFPSTRMSDPEQTYDDIVVGRDETAKHYSVVPFLDVMHFGAEPDKREALSKMTTQFHPNFAPAFRKALVDDSNTIRVQAASAIARIEHQFSETMMKLARLHAAAPENLDLLLAMAEYCDAYAFTGILDADRERANREAAAEHYAAYLARRPDDARVRLALGRLLVRSGQPQRALEWLGSDLFQRGQSGANAAMWTAQALFDAGRLADLRALAATYSTVDEAMQTMHPQFAESLKLWSARA